MKLTLVSQIQIFLKVRWGPNYSFLLKDLLDKYNEAHLIIADFSDASDDLRDRIPERNTLPSHFKATYYLTEKSCLRDGWRFFNPNCKAFTWHNESMQQSRTDL